jgi:hypothetical protein
MEFFLFLGLVFVGAVFFLRRSRARTDNSLDSMTKGLPDDLRDKNTGLASLPNDGNPWSGGR